MSRTIALDTNIVSRFLRGDLKAEVLTVLNEADVLLIPLTVYTELLAGLKAKPNSTKQEKLLQEFLDQDAIWVNNTINIETAEVYADIYTTLRKRGTPISPNDLWIAAECVQRGYPLLTLDKDFNYVVQLRIVGSNPSAFKDWDTPAEDEAWADYQ